MKSFDIELRSSQLKMGRRRKRTEDFDDSLELEYSRKRQELSPSGGHLKSDNQVGSNDHKQLDGETNRQAATERLNEKSSEEDKIEKLRLKKQRRKELQQAKIAKRKEHQEKEKLRLEEEEKKRKQQERANLKKKKTESSQQKFVQCRKGVQYRDVAVGKGAVVQNRKKVRVSYVLRAKNRTGKILDSSDDFGFRLGRGEVIEGWDIGVQGMRVGGKRYLMVPPNAGYGQKDVGGGRGAMLFFEVSLLAC